MLAAALVTALRDVKDVSEEWERLRVRLEASPFLGPTLYTAWLEELAGAETPFLIVVRDASNELRAVAPWVRRGPLVYSLPGRVKVAGELLVSDEDAEVAWTVTLQEAFSQRIVLVAVPHATDNLQGVGGALKAARAQGLPSRALPRFHRFRLDLANQSTEEHLASWARNARIALRKSKNRLNRQGALTFVEVEGPEAYESLRVLHRRQWEPSTTVSWVHLDAGARIDRRLMSAIPSGILLMELDGRPIGASLYFDTGTHRVFLYQTRDESFDRVSLGLVLQAEKIRRAKAKGIQQIDEMGGDPKKARWGLQDHEGFELLIGRSGIVGRGAVAARIGQLKGRRWLTSIRQRASHANGALRAAQQQFLLHGRPGHRPGATTWT
jgi:CelD/BcsL family acetyltransferase involved in cellulose biosynthesis